MFVFFRPIEKTRWQPWPLIGWDIFYFSSETAERNSTKLDRKQDLNALYQVCIFRSDQKKQDGRPGLWLAETYSISPLKRLHEIQRNLTGSKISTSSTKFVFFGLIGKTRWLPLASDWLRHIRLLLWKLLHGIQGNLTGSKISMSSIKFVFFSCRLEKQDGRPGLWLAETFSTSPLKPLNRIQQKLDRKQDLKVLYQVCVFRADPKNKMAVLASDWLRHFRLLLWNCLMEFNETWQEARSQHPLRSLCFWGRSEKKRWLPWPLIGWNIFDFSSKTAEQNSTKLDRKQDLKVLYQVCVFSGRSEKQDGRPGLWLAETFSTSPLKLLNGIQWNLTGSIISVSPTKCVFCGSIRKTRWPPWPLIGWDIFDFSSETAIHNKTKLDRKQDLTVLSQARSQCPLPSLCFVGRSEKQDCRPGLWSAETFSTSPLNLLNGIQQNLTGSKISVSSSKFVFFGPVRKTRWPPQLLIGWDIFDFSSETAERNSTKLDRNRWMEFNKSDSKQDLTSST